MARPTFPLRFTHERLRDLVRVVAEREGISQNELLEQAAEHEVVARGALIADELEMVATQLRSATGPVAAASLDQAREAFVEGERLPDPVRARQFTRDPRDSSQRPAHAGAGAAFKRR